MKPCPVLLLASLLLAGCAGLPCHRSEPVSLEGRGPAEIVAQAAAATPAKLNQFNSIVFEFAGQKFLGIGFMEIDRQERSFRVICLNPMGVKLFDLSGNDNGTTMNFAIEPLARAGDIATAVGNDIRRIYFDLTPRANATPRPGKHRLTYGGGVATGYQEHLFAGTGDLVEKRLYDDQLISWQVTYHDYREKGGKRSPGTIVFTDYRNGYQLTIREKEQTVDNDQATD
jgi:outer membrane biogenesis lipoprotein LolB